GSAPAWRTAWSTPTNAIWFISTSSPRTCCWRPTPSRCCSTSTSPSTHCRPGGWRRSGSAAPRGACRRNRSGPARRPAGGNPGPGRVYRRPEAYSPGRLLSAALAGEDVPVAGSLPPLHRLNPQVSVGLSDLIRKCLAPCPDDRYGSAAALAADLRRHLADLPLQGVPNRSLRERWRKWRRRRPNAPLWAALLLALATAAARLGTGAAAPYQDARRALAEGQSQLERGAYREAVRTLARGRARVDGLPGGGGLVREIDAQLRLARRAQAAQDLHAVAESLR